MLVLECRMSRTRPLRPRALIPAAAVLLALATAGCASVNNAIDAGQSAIDAGQSAISSATGAVEAATDLVAACAAAQAAWIPGVTPSQARQAIGEALALADQAFAIAPGLPGVTEVRDLLMSAKDSLAANPEQTSLGISRGALETACALAAVG